MLMLDWGNSDIDADTDTDADIDAKPESGYLTEAGKSELKSCFRIAHQHWLVHLLLQDPMYKTICSVNHTCLLFS